MTEFEAKQLHVGDKIAPIHKPELIGIIRHLDTYTIFIYWNDGWTGEIAYDNMKDYCKIGNKNN